VVPIPQAASSGLNWVRLEGIYHSTLPVFQHADFSSTPFSSDPIATLPSPLSTRQKAFQAYGFASWTNQGGTSSQPREKFSLLLRNPNVRGVKTMLTLNDALELPDGHTQTYTATLVYGPKLDTILSGDECTSAGSCRITSHKMMTWTLPPYTAILIEGVPEVLAQPS
jgi:hypothetical protein